MRIWLAAIALALAGCAAAPVEHSSERLFHDRLFVDPAQPVSPGAVFARSDAMRHYLEVEIADLITEKGRQRARLEALYSKRPLRLEYASAMTRNAAEAFDARATTSLSLVIITAAPASARGLHVTVQR